MTGITVINAGISGETTSQGVERFAALIEKYHPALIILMEGGNDILRNHPPQTTKQNLSTMLNIAKQKGIPVILIGVPEKKLFSDSAPFYQELADEFDVIFEEELLSNLLRSAEFKSDPIHLNTAGYQRFAEEISLLLKTHGATQ